MRCLNRLLLRVVWSSTLLACLTHCFQYYFYWKHSYKKNYHFFFCWRFLFFLLLLVSTFFVWILSVFWFSIIFEIFTTSLFCIFTNLPDGPIEEEILVSFISRQTHEFVVISNFKTLSFVVIGIFSSKITLGFDTEELSEDK